MSKAIQIRMGGYGPPTTGFSRALKFIGERLSAAFGDRVDIKYVWNIMDLGYRAERHRSLRCRHPQLAQGVEIGTRCVRQGHADRS